MGILDTPLFKIILGLVVFYIGLKMFAGGMKSLGNVKQLEPFVTNPYWMFLGGILCTLAWQSSSLSTTAIVGMLCYPADGTGDYDMKTVGVDV